MIDLKKELANVRKPEGIEIESLLRIASWLGEVGERCCIHVSNLTLSKIRELEDLDIKVTVMQDYCVLEWIIKEMGENR